MIFVISAIVLLVLFVPVVKAKQYAVDFGKGHAALEHDDTAGAIPHLQKYVAARPGDVRGHMLLGAALQQAHRYDEAIQAFESGLAINPNNAYIQVNLAEIYAYQKKTDKALELFKKGMPRAESDALASYWYASALRDAGRFTEAESNARRSIELDPKYADAHQLLAEILTSEGKKAEAEAEFERANQLSKEAPPDQSSK
jgi:Flp pilus assembly protein TadD